MLQLRDVEKLLDRLAEKVQAYVQAQIGSAAGKLATRLSNLEAALAKLPTPRDGKDGASVNVDDLRPLISVEVQDAIARMPIPKDGKDGRDGRSIDLDDVKPFVQTAVSIAMAALPIPKDGEKGRDGESLSVEVIDRLIADRVALAIAKLPAARDGRDGRNGDPGRDSTEVEILGSIVSGRSYPRGTFASHAGGLVRASRDIDPAAKTLETAGWRVIVDGVAAVVVTQKGERTFGIVCQLSSGRQAVTEFSIPTLIDRGVWKAERPYEPGDGVTWDGSFWIAQKSTSEKPGNGSADWRLAVKRGKDGRDGGDSQRTPAYPVARLK